MKKIKTKEERNPLLEALRKYGASKSGLIEICTIDKPLKSIEELREKLIKGVSNPKILK